MPGVITTLPTQQFSQNGEPVSGGSVTVYAANTVTPANTWQDKAQTTLNTNPIILDAQGRCNIWLQPGNVYDFVVKTALGATLYTIEDVAGAIDSVASASVSEWVVTGLTPTFISATSFSVIGNQTATYSVGRRVKATISSGATVYGTITSSAFSSVTTVTLIMDSTSLDSGLSAVDVGIISYVNPSINSVAMLNLSSYSGADIPLAIGQASIYDVSAVTSLLLRIATGNNQMYDISCNIDHGAGATLASNPNLQVNNANFGTNVITNQRADINDTSVSTGTATANNAFFLGPLGKAYSYEIRAKTRTTGKFLQCFYRASSATVTFTGAFTGHCSDTSTAWTSLGTINFIGTVTGQIVVRRVS
jgi:hypothetical protein